MKKTKLHVEQLEARDNPSAFPNFSDEFNARVGELGFGDAARFTTGDLTGDGAEEMVIYEGVGGGPVVLVLRGSRGQVLLGPVPGPYPPLTLDILYHGPIAGYDSESWRGGVQGLVMSETYLSTDPDYVPGLLVFVPDGREGGCVATTFSWTGEAFGQKTRFIFADPNFRGHVEINSDNVLGGLQHQFIVQAADPLGAPRCEFYDLDLETGEFTVLHGVFLDGAGTDYTGELRYAGVGHFPDGRPVVLVNRVTPLGLVAAPAVYYDTGLPV